MQTNIFQLIEDCLKNNKIRTTGEGPISAYPKMQCLEHLLENNPSSPEINYALREYHKIVNNSEVREEYFTEAKDLLPDVKSKIDELINNHLKNHNKDSL